MVAGRLPVISGGVIKTKDYVLSRTKVTGGVTLYVRTPPVTVTMTIASPCVVTWATHRFTGGEQVVFNSTGALPTGLVMGQIYYVLSAGLTTNTFRVSLTAGGIAITSTGVQSGVHGGCTGSDSNDGIDNTRAHALLSIDRAQIIGARDYDTCGGTVTAQLAKSRYIPDANTPNQGVAASWFQSGIGNNFDIYGDPLDCDSYVLDGRGGVCVMGAGAGHVTIGGLTMCDSVGPGSGDAFGFFCLYPGCQMSASDTFKLKSFNGGTPFFGVAGEIQLDGGPDFTVDGGTYGHFVWADKQMYIDIANLTITMVNNPAFGIFLDTEGGSVAFGATISGACSSTFKAILGERGCLGVNDLSVIPGTPIYVRGVGVVNSIANPDFSALVSDTHTVSQLPTGWPTGTRAVVTDATATTFMSTVAGTGGNTVPVFFDGTNWKIG